MRECTVHQQIYITSLLRVCTAELQRNEHTFGMNIIHYNTYFLVLYDLL